MEPCVHCKISKEFYSVDLWSGASCARGLGLYGTVSISGRDLPLLGASLKGPLLSIYICIYSPPTD